MRHSRRSYFTKPTSVRFSDATRKALEQVSIERNVPVSWLIQEAVKLYEPVRKAVRKLEFPEKDKDDD